MASDDLAKLGWITDRLPTAADADSDGDVRILSKKEAGPTESWRWQNWGAVAPGQPWWSHEAAAAAEAAASETGSAELAERAMTTHQLVYRLNAVNQELARRVREGLI